MHPLTQLRPFSPPTSHLQAALVITAVAVSVITHAAAAALGPAGAMAWWMAAMAVACLACAAPMVGRPRCTSRAAEHLLGMGIAMILIHLALFAMPGAGTHHGTEHGAGTSHGAAMLALLGVELVCLMLASAALRLGQRSPRMRKQLPAHLIPSPTH
ncbi:hypothetical protein [Arthrobacter sp. D2-10]